jgi:hypothetical protein
MVRRKGVTIMEELLLNIETAGPALVFLGAVAALVFAVGAVFFGYMAEEEKNGRKLGWAEWPIPESDKTLYENTPKLRLVA